MRKTDNRRTHRVIPVAAPGVVNPVIEPRTPQTGPRNRRPTSNFPLMQSTGFKLNP